MIVSIVGASGYVGGELLRLLHDHPKIELQQATSEKHVGEYIYQQHPNLRKRSLLKFTSITQLEKCDLLYLALPHGESQRKIEEFDELADRIIDLSADFRLKDASTYQSYYGENHANPAWLSKFVYGLPEIHRDELRSARYVSGVGCNATAVNLALLPLVQADMLEKGHPVFVEVKVGSSEGGAAGNPGSHHPERSGVIRTFSPFGHRHTAEVIQETGIKDIHLTITSVDLVRGALATVHCFIKSGVENKDLWKAYREVVNQNPFLRVVKEKRGIYRVPEPKILAGANYADLGFELDENNSHLVAMCAIDNMMKGAAGSAVQSMNIMMGWEETLGLEFCGLHPI